LSDDGEGSSKYVEGNKELYCYANLSMFISRHNSMEAYGVVEVLFLTFLTSTLDWSCVVSFMLRLIYSRRPLAYLAAVEVGNMPGRAGNGTPILRSSTTQSR